MSVLDLFLVGVIAAGAAAGWQMGLVRRALSWILAIVCLGAAILAISAVLSRVDRPTEYWIVLVVLVGLVGAAMIGHAVGDELARRVRRGIRTGRTGRTDQVGGALLGGLGVVAIIWLMSPSVLASPGWLGRQASDAATIRALQAVTPEPPEVFGRLDALTGNDGFSPIVGGARPDVGPPPTTPTMTAELETEIGRSLVKIHAVACSERHDGSGFLVASDLVLTNAHVVAGATRVRAETGERVHEDVAVVGFDAARDLALLRIPSTTLPVLPFAEGVQGTQATAFGFPGGNDLRSQPVTLTERVRARGRDLFDERDITRRVFFMAADLGAGDSGGPVVDDDGGVVAVVFAVAPDDEQVAFALSSDEVETFLAEHPEPRPTSTGECL